MAFRCTPATKDPVATLAYKPWTLAIEPFQVAPHTWYVAGQTWVGCYLIDTGEGLILIDAAIPESMYMLVDSIYKIGFKPTDIKKILISHAHFDHITNAAFLAQELKVPVALHPADLPLLEHQSARPLNAQGVRGQMLRYFSQKLMQKPLEPFSPEILLSDGMRLNAYGVDAQVIELPGHTAGSTGVIAGEAIVVGDALMRMPALSPPLIFEDRKSCLESVSRIRESGAKIVLTSHGFTIRRRFFV